MVQQLLVRDDLLEACRHRRGVAVDDADFVACGWVDEGAEDLRGAREARTARSTATPTSDAAHHRTR